MKTFVIGDIHGRIEALNEVLKLSNFCDEEDKLIILGDVCDGGANTKEVVSRLLGIENRIFIYGNHDLWFKKYLETNIVQDEWYFQGGKATLESYKYDYPYEHKKFWNSGIAMHMIGNFETGLQDIFVHGGFNPYAPISHQTLETMTWDRELHKLAALTPIETYNRIFIGHTTTEVRGSTTPLKLNNLWMMDTGAGWSGRLSIMNIETEEYWCSEIQVPNR